MKWVNASVNNGLKFLTQVFENNKGYSTVSGARSVLSTLIRTTDNVEFGKQQVVEKHMRGSFHLRPSLPEYSFVCVIRQLL